MNSLAAEGSDRRPVLIDLGIGLLGLFVSVRVRIVGDLYLTEVCLLLLLPFLLLRSQPHPATNRTQPYVLTLGGFWLLSEVISNMVHEIPFADWSRGISKIVFLLLNYVALRRLLNSNRRLMLFLFGLVVGCAILSARDGMTGEILWKFWLGAAVSICLLMLASGSTLRILSWLPVFVLIAIGTYSILITSRSLAGMSFMAAAVLGVGIALRLHHNVTLGWRTFATLSLVVSGFLIYVGFGTLASNGTFGETAQRGYENQVKRGGGSLLLGGRAEWRASLLAIRDSPLLGHGSWARNNIYANTYRSRLYAETGERQPLASDEDIIPSHSYVTGAWVQAGVLGAIFWFYVLGLALFSLFSLLTWKPPLGPVAVFMATQMLWDIPFSPFGGTQRIYEAVGLILIPIAASHARSIRYDGSVKSQRLTIN